MKRLLLLLTLFLGSAFVSAYPATDTPKISLLTCGPTDDYVFYLYGHTALRVQYQGEDLVYNYGYFSLEQKHFMLNFIVGRPMYSLGVTGFEDFLWEYASQGRSVVEQELALTEAEATELNQKLIRNALPEHRDYQYNFYFDNCATRPRDMIEEVVGGIEYKIDTTTLPTFREAIRSKSHTSVWYTLGADICLGWKSDEQMTIADAAFLPSLLEQQLDSAYRSDAGAPLVTHKVTWLEQTKEIDNPLEKWHYPAITFLLIGGLLALLKWRKRARSLVIVQKLLYALLGIGSIIVWFLALGSEHPHTWPNAHMLFLHPLWLWLLFTHGQKKYSKINKWLYFGNFVAITCYLLLGLIQKLPIDLPILAIVVALDQMAQWRESRRVNVS